MDDAAACSASLLDAPEIDSCCAAADVTLESSKYEPVAPSLGAAPLLQPILTEADAQTAIATFDILEWKLFDQVFCGTGDRFSSISAVLEHRHAILNEDDDDVEDDDAVNQVPAGFIRYNKENSALNTIEEDGEDDDADDDEEQVFTSMEMRVKAKEDADVHTKKALSSIKWAAKACDGRFADEFNLARENLHTGTSAGAAAAQLIIHVILIKCPSEKAEKALQPADRTLRDVVTLRCCEHLNDAKDRNGFLELANHAYGGTLYDGKVNVRRRQAVRQSDLAAQLLLAYHRLMKIKKRTNSGFVSNNKVEADRRGGPRPKRGTGWYSVQSGAAADTGGTSTCNHDEADEATTCESICADPAYVTVDAANHSQSEACGLSSIIYQMDGGMAPAADVMMVQPQPLLELSPPMTVYTYAAYGYMPNAMQYVAPVHYTYDMNGYHMGAASYQHVPNEMQYGAPFNCTYDMNGYQMGAASEQHVMLQSGTHGFRGYPLALHHPPTGKGNGKCNGK